MSAPHAFRVVSGRECTLREWWPLRIDDEEVAARFNPGDDVLLLWPGHPDTRCRVIRAFVAAPLTVAVEVEFITAYPGREPGDVTIYNAAYFRALPP